MITIPDTLPRMTAGIPLYEHVFVIIAENKAYGQIIGPDSKAANIDRLAKQYGLASRFYGEVHPSQGNYIALLAGDTYGIHDNDAYYCKPGLEDPFCEKSAEPTYVDHTLAVRSLGDQLEQHGLTWKAYLESLPEPGSLAVRWPTAAQPVAGVPPELYAAKHAGFVLFKHVQDDPERAAKLVDFAQLDRDLAAGAMPSFALIVPNQCNDMHGRDPGPHTPADCARGNLAGLIARGDPDQGCCGSDPASAANFGGGSIATVVITNHGPRGVLDPTPYNHYSLLRTVEDAFGIAEHLGHAADDAHGVRSMTPLFAARPRR